MNCNLYFVSRERLYKASLDSEKTLFVHILYVNACVETRKYAKSSVTIY